MTLYPLRVTIRWLWLFKVVVIAVLGKYDHRVMLLGTQTNIRKPVLAQQPSKKECT